MNSITPTTIEDIALGATVLGTGGGGDPHIGELVAKQAVEDHGTVEFRSPDELKDDAFVIPVAQMGAPTVSMEKPPSGNELMKSVDRIESEVGREATAIMPVECGGINSTFPIAVAAQRGLPLVDADGMGRAFPELQHETFNIYGVSGTPAVVSDAHGNVCVLETKDNEYLEQYARAVTIRMGGTGYLADYPMNGSQVKRTAIPNTMSLARDLGEAIRTAEGDTFESIQSITDESNYGKARALFTGKIRDVKRRTEEGFVVGHANLTGIGSDEGRSLSLQFQNENLAAKVDGTYIATVPDLITVVDDETTEPVPTERLRYGARVQVIGIMTPPIMRTSRALDVWGPRAFGIDTEYEPLEEVDSEAEGSILEESNADEPR